MQRHGWTLLFHDCLIEQLQRLHTATLRIDKNVHADNANAKLLRALSHLILDVVPSHPANDAYRQSNTLGSAYRHWRRAKIGRRFRLFFRYDTKSKVIVYAWVNDARTLRATGSKSDPYVVFAKMLKRGHPPDGWSALMAASQENWDEPPKSEGG